MTAWFLLLTKNAGAQDLGRLPESDAERIVTRLGEEKAVAAGAEPDEAAWEVGLSTVACQRE